jgi:hypothetical protein
LNLGLCLQTTGLHKHSMRVTLSLGGDNNMRHK